MNELTEGKKGTIYTIPTIKGTSVRYVYEGEIYTTPDDLAAAMEEGLTEEQKEELIRIGLEVLDEWVRYREDE